MNFKKEETTKLLDKLNVKLIGEDKVSWKEFDLDKRCSALCLGYNRLTSPYLPTVHGWLRSTGMTV